MPNQKLIIYIFCGDPGEMWRMCVVKDDQVDGGNIVAAHG